MTKNKLNMDNFLRESLEHVEIKPSQNVWKNISKQLIILELIRFNFTNFGKIWFFSGLAVVATIGGITYYNFLNKSNDIQQTSQSTEITISQNATIDNSVTEPIASLEIITNPEEIETESSPQASSNKTYHSVQKTGMQNKANLALTTINEESKLLTSGERLYFKGQPLMRREIGYLPEKEKTMIENPQKSDDSAGLESSGLNTTNQNTNWVLSGFYQPEWPVSNAENYNTTNQIGLKAGVEYNRWNANIGIGYQWGKTPTKYLNEYSTFDSVGFFYDIDYFEVVPGYPDSVIIHYTTVAIFDSVAQTAEMQGQDKTREWIIIPLEIGYRFIKLGKYELNGQLNAQFGFLTNDRKKDETYSLSSSYIIKDITPTPNPYYIQMGLGLENSFNLLPHWWIYAEPKVNYYLNNSFTLNGSRKGPVSFGIQIGLKYKL